MALESLMTTPVTVVRPSLATDRNRNQVPDWAGASSTSTRGWLAQTSAAELIEAGRDGGMSAWLLYLPAGTVIDRTCRVQVSGVTYDVDGPVNRAPTPRGEHHVEVRLRLVEG